MIITFLFSSTLVLTAILFGPIIDGGFIGAGVTIIVAVGVMFSLVVQLVRVSISRKWRSVLTHMVCAFGVLAVTATTLTFQDQLRFFVLKPFYLVSVKTGTKANIRRSWRWTTSDVSETFVVYDPERAQVSDQIDLGGGCNTNVLPLGTKFFLFSSKCTSASLTSTH